MQKLLVLALATVSAISADAANPFLPLWEHIPDGEPHIFDDPDNPGRKRLYLYGSHDMLRTQYCGTDLVVWSAQTDSLDAWRYDGVIFKVSSPDGKSDVLYAPDVAELTRSDGSKEYYLYPNNQVGGRNGMVARASRPDGPFEVINWSKEDSTKTDGVFRFDPAVLADDDGRVYGYWGFDRSMAAEIDPSTMSTVKPGTEVVDGLISSRSDDGQFRFYEASSIRKVKDKYVLVYSRWSAPGDFGLPASNYTLAYAYSDSPLGPYTYGGTIIDGRGRDTDATGNPMVTATPNGNTHGSIIEVNGRWYVFYHRQSGVNEYSRQAMVAPIEVSVEEGPGGKVMISEAEYTSEGFETSGLNPLRRYPAAIASHFTGPEPAVQKYPKVHYTGPYFPPVYIDDHKVDDPYNDSINVSPVVNNTNGSILGYKYFNFRPLAGKKNVSLILDLIPEGIDGIIRVYTTAPWKGEPQPVGSIELSSSMARTRQQVSIPLSLSGLSGKHPLYLTFSSEVPCVSLCTLYSLQFMLEDGVDGSDGKGEM
ncbi:MAG: family 43 glycosylhydrolase [Muribaculaceae bacterium]|nr:family 43 glycosylhydrolase [Muribaculaceae bacterium]